MAKLSQPESNSFETGPLAPAGTFVATCLEVLDQFGVQRPKFENPSEMETLDVTRFLLGFIGQDGQPYKVQSFEFRISGSPKSNLFKFLTSWLGNPPKYGWDYCGLKGHGAMITVAHKLSRDGSKTYANLVGISPVIDQLKAQIPPLEAFPVTEGRSAASAPVPAAHIPANVPHPPSPSASNAPQPPAVNQSPPPQQPWNPESDPEENCPF